MINSVLNRPPKTMHAEMLWPLLVSAIGFTFVFAASVTARLRAAVMERRIRGLLMAQVDRLQVSAA